MQKKQKFCQKCKEEFNEEFNEDQNQPKVWDQCHYTEKYRGAAHSIGNLRQKTAKQIFVVLLNGSNYDYHFIIKELVERFHGKFDCLGKKDG